MYKHVSLRTREVDGTTTWLLLGPDGRPLEAFSAFVKANRNAPRNTRIAYFRHLAEFFDYLIEATELIGRGRPLSKLELTEVLEAYGEYLLLGVDASKPIARTVATSLPPGKNKPSSVIPKKAAVRQFLKLSEAFRKELLQLARSVDMRVADSPVLVGIGEKRFLQPSEVKAMQSNTMIGGVIAGGPKLAECIVLKDSAVDQNYDERRAFPYDKVIDLIDAMPTYRDKTFHSLLAASGCRTHEGLQILFNSDIDLDEGTVRLVNPNTRPGDASYRILTPAQRELLAWKGRTTDLTLLIEPFASKFFESLEQYLNREYIAHGRHDFLFQYSWGSDYGAPHFLSSASSRLELFHRICKYVGVSLPAGTGVHSLRHMYATYALNYFPRSNGDYGLPVPLVQQLLAHANVESTLKYAKFDRDLLKLEAQNVNRVIFSNGVPKRLLELKLEALQAQVLKVQAQLKIDAIPNA